MKLKFFKSTNKRQEAQNKEQSKNQNQTPQQTIKPEEQSSIEIIKQLQKEIRKLEKQKLIEKQSEASPVDIINYINDNDQNILVKYYSFHKGLNTFSYDYKKETRSKWMNFVFLFDFLEDISKEKIINYLISYKKTKHVLQDIDNQITLCEDKIKEEKQKLGIN